MTFSDQYDGKSKQENDEEFFARNEEKLKDFFNLHFCLHIFNVIRICRLHKYQDIDGDS